MNLFLYGDFKITTNMAEGLFLNHELTLHEGNI